MIRPYVEGQDLNGMNLWHGYMLRDHEWISTGRKHLLITHTGLTHLIAFYLEHYPITHTIRYSNDKHYEVINVPSAMPYKLADVVTEILVGKS